MGEFDLSAYYGKVHSGDIVDNTDILEYIKSFEQVVLWGASYLGSAMGKYLLENGVNIKEYWDMRCNELEKVNGINVVMPFTTQNKENTLVIFA